MMEQTSRRLLEGAARDWNSVTFKLETMDWKRVS